MRDLKGHIYVLREESSADIDELAESQGHFTLATRKWLIPEGKADMCIISCSGKAIDYVALVHRGPKVTTSQYRLTFDNLVPIHPYSLSFNELRADVSPFAESELRTALAEGYASISSDTWPEMFEAIRRLRPAVAQALTALQNRLRQYLSRNVGQPGYEVMAQEHDAINTALWIAGFDRESVYRRHVVSPGSVMPVIQVLGGTPASEDALLDFDKRVVSPVWREVLANQIGASKFQKDDGSELTVINVNRKKVEESLGVDLIYVNHDYRSFVMVQYKRMVKESDKRWGYRPDSQCKEEVERMQRFMLDSTISTRPMQQREYRLHPGPFYFKLCATSAPYEPFTEEPIKGMYLPLDYWQVLQTCAEVKGPRGGVRLTYENVGRYMTTSEFVGLIQSGWTGSQQVEFDRIAEIVIAGIRDEKSVMIAMGKGAA